MEHEVLPVTEGHRITLTYNLYAKTKAVNDLPLHDISINPLYKELSAALRHPYFMRGGGVLGFVCQHKYAYRDLNSTSSLPHLLKGADEVVYSVGKSLGLSAVVKPVLSDRYHRSSGIPLNKFAKKFRICNSHFEEDVDRIEAVCLLFNDGHHIEHITWCQKNLLR